LIELFAKKQDLEYKLIQAFNMYPYSIQFIELKKHYQDTLKMSEMALFVKEKEKEDEISI